MAPSRCRATARDKKGKARQHPIMGNGGSNSATESTKDWISFHLKKRYLVTNTGGQDSWQNLPEIPTAQELLTERDPEILIKPVNPQPASKAEYLETQYRLCRVEATELIRRAIRRFRSDEAVVDTNDFHIYTQVHILGYLCSRQGVACRVSFSTERATENISWRDSQRLTPGKLVVLSKRADAFQTTCLVATIAGRQIVGGLEPDLRNGEGPDTPPRVDIFWAQHDEATIDPSIEYVMLEAKGGYFESLRHTMVGLQHAAHHDSKFDDCIVKPSHDSLLAPTNSNGQARPAIIDDFDSSQQQAFECMNREGLSIVQGPPGTGKTFTSVGALQSLVMSKPNPVIVAAETNHALDQLLSACSQTFEANYVRLGGRSEDEEILLKTMFEVRKNFAKKGFNVGGEKRRKEAEKDIANCLTLCFPTDTVVSADTFLHATVLTRDQHSSLSAAVEGGIPEGVDPIELWLEHKLANDTTVAAPTEPVSVEALGNSNDTFQQDKIDDEKNKLDGLFIPIELPVTRSFGGRAISASALQRARVLAEGNSDLYDIKAPRRSLVYGYLRQALIDKTTKIFRGLVRDYKARCDDILAARWAVNVEVIKHHEVQIIGCTTTGLTKYRGMIAALKPKVLLIEEAAEAREANITSALYPSLNQLILVGDHQQLVPSVDVQELGFEPYNFHVSLFERLVKAGVPYSMLSVQRRMIPAIREVIQEFYPSITDHEIVRDPEKRPPVPGMNGINHWWFDHSFPDYQTSTMSRSNLGEAQMIVKFAKYLVQNGMLPSQITILSYYKAQVETIEREIKTVFQSEHKALCSVRTVDGFQGEQNDIILLSQVRSCGGNPEASPGFVQNENRAVVALSRAKCGLYVFGNQSILYHSEPSIKTWHKVLEVFKRRRNGELEGSIGDYLPITCVGHGKKTEIRSVDDWDKVSQGGCEQHCQSKCSQGHSCAFKCHPFGLPACECRRPCEKQLPCGHACSSLCGEPCKCSIKACSRPQIRSSSEIGAPKLTFKAPERQTKSVASSRASSSSGRQPANPYRTSEALLQGGYRSHMSLTTPSETSGLDSDEWSVPAHSIPASPTSTPRAFRETYIPTRVEYGKRIVGDPVSHFGNEGVLIDLSEDDRDDKSEKRSNRLERNELAVGMKSESLISCEVLAMRGNPRESTQTLMDLL